MRKDSKAKDIDTLYKTQKGNIYKVNKRVKSKPFKILFSNDLLKNTFVKDESEYSQKDAIEVGGEIFTPTDSSIETQIDPI